MKSMIAEQNTSPKPIYPCTEPGCGKSFTTPGNLKTHLLIHQDARPFTCPEPGCGGRFRQAVNLKAHIRTHTKERPYKCLSSECSRYFTALSSVRRHIRQFHSLDGTIPSGSYVDFTKPSPTINRERPKPLSPTPTASNPTSQSKPKVIDVDKNTSEEEDDDDGESVEEFTDEPQSNSDDAIRSPQAAKAKPGAHLTSKITKAKVKIGQTPAFNQSKPKSEAQSSVYPDALLQLSQVAGTYLSSSNTPPQTCQCRAPPGFPCMCSRLNSLPHGLPQSLPIGFRRHPQWPPVMMPGALPIMNFQGKQYYNPYLLPPYAHQAFFPMGSVPSHTGSLQPSSAPSVPGFSLPPQTSFLPPASSSPPSGNLPPVTPNPTIKSDENHQARHPSNSSEPKFSLKFLMD